MGLLTRNIRLDAELQPDCYFNTDKEEANCKRFRRDTYGGHVKVSQSVFDRGWGGGGVERASEREKVRDRKREGEIDR